MYVFISPTELFRSWVEVVNKLTTNQNEVDFGVGKVGRSVRSNNSSKIVTRVTPFTVFI